MKDNTAKVIPMHKVSYESARHGGPILRSGPIQHGMAVIAALANVIRFGGVIAEFTLLLSAAFLGEPGSTSICIMTALAAASGLGGLMISAAMDTAYAAIMGIAADQSMESLLGSAVFHASSMEDLECMVPGDIFDIFRKHSLDSRAKAWRKEGKA